MSEERQILMTGADGTIGAAVRSLLASTGNRIATIGHQPGIADHVADFTCDDELKAAVDAIPGTFDGFVFAHGMLLPGPIDHVPPSEWRRMFAVNLDSIYALIYHCLPRFAEGASIVVVSSTAAFDRSPVGGPHYTASKWALNGLVRHLAFDLGPRGVRINSVCPGTVEGPMARALLSTEEYEQSLKAIPLGRAADASEVAELVAFLLDGKAGYVTGSNVSVSGGYR